MTFTVNHAVEAACFAILCRIAPVLRHDIAGLMQPVRLLATVLERRLLKPDLDRETIAENVRSVNLLTKDATVECMNIVAWLTPPNSSPDGALVNLRSSVDEIRKLLALEFANRSITLVNNIGAGAEQVPQSFMRTVFTGLLLAFCDENSTGGQVQVSLLENMLTIRVIKADNVHHQAADISPPVRPIRWQDVQAMASAFELAPRRGDGWIEINLQHLKR
jgi:hypothetical protein